jgi:hypothetical protein
VRCRTTKLPTALIATIPGSGADGDGRAASSRPATSSRVQVGREEQPHGAGDVLGIVVGAFVVEKRPRRLIDQDEVPLRVLRREAEDPPGGRLGGSLSYSLGVDLGTTFVAAAVVRGSRVEMVTLGDRTVVTPAVVYARDDGSLVTGEAANRRAVSSPERVGREFKRRLGDPTPVMLGGPFDPLPRKEPGRCPCWQNSSTPSSVSTPTATPTRSRSPSPAASRSP